VLSLRPAARRSSAWAALIPPDSFYSRLAAVRDLLVNDDLYRPLYKDSRKGRPSLPLSLVLLTMLLQYYDDCSDRETEARVRFDLRWKHALGLDLEDAGFDATVLSVFRRKLVEQDLTCALFDRLITAAWDAGILANTADQLIDSSHILGVAGVRDTYTLIRGGIRCDGAYGTADVRADLGERGIEVVAKLRPMTDTKHLGKDQFVIDLGANDGQGSVTCPVGVTTTDFRMARDQKDRAVRLFRFPAETCAACSLRDRCLGGEAGRVEHPVRQPPRARRLSGSSFRRSSTKSAAS
jgi:transposase